MAYRDWSYDEVRRAFGLRTVVGPLFPGLEPIVVPPWLPESIARLQRSVALTTEKSRNEIVVVQVLVAAKEMGPKPLSIYSGHRLDVDSARGLAGECDFLVARAELFAFVRALVLTVVQAKRLDIDAGLGQGIAQMLGARLFNERDGIAPRPMWGCVTTGERWQFLRLDGDELGYDLVRLRLDELGTVLAALVRTLAD